MKCTQVLIKEPKKRNKRKNPVISKTHNNEFEVAPYIPPFMRGGSVAINSTARLPLVPRPRCLVCSHGLNWFFLEEDWTTCHCALRERFLNRVED